MARVITKIGDVFEVSLPNGKLRYFQFVAIDGTQISSSVIRVFKKPYEHLSKPDLNELVKGEIEFYAHTILKIGIKLGYWTKVGKAKEVGKVDATFRCSSDYGDPVIKISKRWWIWKVNEEFKYVGELTEEDKKAEIGVVIAADSIVHRMRTGYYDFVFPEFE
jgi:hypothetical protein